MPKSDKITRNTWLTPGYASLLMGGRPSDQTIINAIRDGRLDGIITFGDDDTRAYSVQWGRVRSFTPRIYTRKS